MNTARGGIKRGIQRERSATVIFKPIAFDAAGGKRQDRVEPIECLNRRLLINTEHGGMLRRVQIQSDNVGGLVSKSGSSLAMYRSRRRGLSHASFQTR